MAHSGEQQVYVIAATALSQEFLTLRREDDDKQTQLTIRALWQALHVYGKCWLLAEPLDHTLYKCRVASSRAYLNDPQRSLSLFLSAGELQEALDAEVTPIAWRIVEKKIVGENGKAYCIEYPINVSSHCEEPEKPEQSTSPVSTTEETKIVSLAAYKEQKAQETEPITIPEEKVAFDSLRAAATALKPDLQPGQHPERRDMPLILLRAVLSNLEQRLEYEHDPRERKALRQSLRDVCFMLTHPRLWRWDSDNYVSIVDEDQSNGLCTVSVHIHPQSRVNKEKAVRQSSPHAKQNRHNTKKRYHRSVS